MRGLHQATGASSSVSGPHLRGSWWCWMGTPRSWSHSAQANAAASHTS